MKAIVYSKYGSPDVLQLKDVNKPVPGSNEVLVSVHAASVNSWDWDLVRGKPYLFRLLSGLFKPKFPILGADISGTVEQVGTSVKKFNPGDEVFGDISESWGGFAEYVCTRETTLKLKPASLNFVEAAAIPQAGVLALQGIRDYGQVKPQQQVLINGAGGGVGTFAVQIAKYYGAKVTAVDRTEKRDMLLSIGADHFIDYKREDFTKNGQLYDLILDVTAKRSIFSYKKSLLPHGLYVMIGGNISTILQVAFLGSLISRFGRKKMRLLVHKPNKGMDFLIELFENGKIKPIIDRTYKLSEVPKAISYLGEGHVKGKVVIKTSKNG